MIFKKGDHIIPEEPENVFKNLLDLHGEVPQYFFHQPEWEIVDVITLKRPNTNAVIVFEGMPTLFDSELKQVFGNYTIKYK